MKPLRKAVTMSVIAGCLIASSPAAWGGDLVGGYLNSRSREAALAVQSGNQRVQIINTAKKIQWGGTQYGSARLFVVDAAGRVMEYRRAFRDRIGHVVSLPQTASDKVIILNRYGNIALVAGFDDSDVAALVPRDGVAQANVIALAQKTPLFGALRYSSHVLRDYKADSASTADMLLTSVRFMAGADVQNLVWQLMAKSAPNYLKGITPVAQGGDGSGGGSLVAQGGDGSGGGSIVNPIAQGGDGSGGGSIVNPIAQGGDGSGGGSLVNPIAQGGDGSGGGSIVNDLSVKVGQQTWTTVPAVRGLNALTQGRVISLQ